MSHPLTKKLLAIGTYWESKKDSSPMECLCVYDPTLKSSWPTQNGLHVSVGVFSFDLVIWGFFLYFSGVYLEREKDYEVMKLGR